MRKGWAILGVVVAGLLLAPVIVPIFVPLSAINCRHEDINIKTGQARYSWSLWFVTVSERIKDTSLSEAMQGEMLDVADIRAWHRVNTFSPGLHRSPHYRFHSALHQARQLDAAFRTFEVEPEDQRVVAREVLRLWQTSGNDYGAYPPIDRLIEQGVSNSEVQSISESRASASSRNE